MSVFDLPRLHFGGTAVTRLPTGPRSGLLDLATNRALTQHGPFPVDRPVEEYHEYLDRHGLRFDSEGRTDPGGVFGATKGTNFGGNGHFWIDAAIVSAEGPDGLQADPVVGRAVDMWGHYNEYLATTVNRGRVFDVDPTSNWTTTLMVGQFGFGRSGRSHDTGYMVTGNVSGMHPPRWHRPDYVRDVGGHYLAPQMRRSVVYQFVVSKDEGLDWLPESSASPIATLLRSVVSSADMQGLVVQFALSNMAPPITNDAPDRWDVRGTIAPWRGQELRTYPAGRLLTPRAAGRGSGQTLHNLTASIEDDRVTLNMITAVPVTGRTPGSGTGPTPALGPRCDLGDLELRAAHTGRLVARIPVAAYRGGTYDLTSGIVTALSELPGEIVDDEPLCVTGAVPGGERAVLLQEEEVNLQVDDACLFLEHPNRPSGDDHPAEVMVRSFVRGRPGPVDTVHVRPFVNPRSRPLDPAMAGARCGDVDIVEVREGRLDGSGGYGPTCVTSTDSQGRGWFTMRGVRAGAGRILISGREDDLPCDPDAAESAARAYDDADQLGYWAGAGWMTVRVLPDDWHLDAVASDDVTFELVYREVFAYYELLYSFMKAEVFSLADECKVKTYPRLIWQMCDPRNRSKTYYMPPTRDMSEPKARLLLKFLRAQQSVTDIPIVVPVPRTDTRGITTRGELLAALKWAATIEVAVMLQYLYAAYSIPTYGGGREHVRRGLWTPEQLRLACGDGGETTDGGVRGALLSVAREEMIHFLMVNNIIMAIGEPFHIPVVDFGTINSTLPVPLDFALEPLGVGSLQRFIAIERPEAQSGEIRRAAGQGFSSYDSSPFAGSAGGPVRSYSSLSELYEDIREGLQRVPDLFMVSKGRGGGEHHLFLRESINTVHPDYQLEVDDLPSALFAIDVVTEQGEGNKLTSVTPSGESHYETFLRLSDLLMAEQMAGPRAPRPPWTPAYPVPRNPTVLEGNANRELVTDPDARAVMHLFNRSYYLMFQLMVQHFGQTPDASLRRSKLMNAAIDVMTGMMSPLAELLVTMPSGRRGKTAGPSFDLEDEPRYNSRPDVAMRSVALRFSHLAAAARKCPAVPARVTDMYSFYAEYFRHFQQAP
nr:chromopyrrolic acid synthase [uncultured bacterium]